MSVKFFSGILYCLASVLPHILTKETTSEVLEAGMTSGRVGRYNSHMMNTNIQYHAQCDVWNSNREFKINDAVIAQRRMEKFLMQDKKCK